MAKGKLVLKKERCKGCELCVEVCPEDILTLNLDEVNIRDYHPVTVTDEDKCTGCSNCAVICPDGVINVYIKED